LTTDLTFISRRTVCGDYILYCLWPPCVADADIILLSCFFLCSFFLFSSPNLNHSVVADWMSTILSHSGLSANLECTSEMYCTRLAEIQDAKKSPKTAISAPSHKFVGLCLRN